MSTSINTRNIQGDVILGLHKRVEGFMFLSLKPDKPSISKFRHKLKSELLPQITTIQQIIDTDEKIRLERGKNPNVVLPLVEVNISFSASGLLKLGIPAEELPGSPKDAFQSSQRSDAITNLADPLHPQTRELRTWSQEYLRNAVDVVILVTAPDNHLLNQKLHEFQRCLEDLTQHIFVRRGNVRPGDNAGHEHFGYLDGLSQPQIKGFNDGQGSDKVGVVGPEVILVGQAGSQTPLSQAKSWQKDGSFLVVRELQQLVPEFDQFVVNLATKSGNDPGVIGARIVGRWKSGAPVDMAPEEDDPSLARSQEFDFSDDFLQVKCPYAAHTRKTNPRAGMQGVDPVQAILPHLMVRNGIPYGPEVTNEERKQRKSIENRGLMFVCYQSSIESGFQRVQQHWSNDITFPPNNPSKITPGFDLIVGQNNSSHPRVAQNILPKGEAGAVDANNIVTAPIDFVIPRGGEYLFVPSIEAIKNKLGS